MVSQFRFERQAAMTIAQNTEYACEGPRAFVEKRELQFKGR